jgi:hypothetical protein
MRIQATIIELTDEQWSQFHEVLKTEYQFHEGDSRVCLTLIHGNEERHLELPLAAFGPLMNNRGVGEALHAAFGPFREAMKNLRRPVLPSPNQVRNLSAKEAVDLAAELNEDLDENQRRSKLESEWERVDPEGVAALRESAARLCDHGSPVVKKTPSLFHDEQPVYTHADGCQSYGPYAG